MHRRIWVFVRVCRNYGLQHAVRFSLAWFFIKITEKKIHQFVNLEVFDQTPQVASYINSRRFDDQSPLVWFVPAWSNVWGGGHFTLFRFAHLMSRFRPNMIFVYNNEGRNTKAHFKNSLDFALHGNDLRVLADPNEIPEDAIPIATTWQSVFSVLKHSVGAPHKFYFMQDFESFFYAFGTQSMQAIESYKQGFIPITGGPWLLSKYHENGEHLVDGISYMFTVDHELFYPNPRANNVIKRILFYGRPSTERRCFELGIASLKLVKEKYPNIEILIAGHDGIVNVGFEATMVGSVALPQLGELYRSCDLGIALSGTNLSYLPIELMACGVPVISNNGPHVEWFCENNVNSLLVPPFPTAILSAVESLIKSDELYKKLRAGGIEKVLNSNWEKESEKIYQFIEVVLKE